MIHGPERLEVEAVVIGAGVVGLAVARALAMAGRETLILEKNQNVGMETSARNSEVIHAGLYPHYRAGSLKARLCVRGRDLLYAFAASHGVPHRRIGKWLVAADPREIGQLEAIEQAALSYGVTDLARVPAAQVRAEEPDLRFAEVLSSPSTGIVDSHAFMLAMLGEAESHGAQLSRMAVVKQAVRENGLWRLTVDNDGDEIALHARLVVNSAGLWAPGLAARFEGLPPEFIPAQQLVKGNYATINGQAPFRRLIYPMPEPGGLGVHLTLDLGGQGRLGPDVEALPVSDPARIDYAVRPAIAEEFAARARPWWPGADADRLAPAYSGVRPHIGRDVDFRIDGPQTHGLAGLVNLFGIASPGLTSSLAIGDYVRDLLDE